MLTFHRLWFACAVLALTTCLWAEEPQSTRVPDLKYHAYTGTSGYPYRAKSDYILGVLDIQPGDVVIDVGAGDGWWTDVLAKQVGEAGTVHACEVTDKLVSKLQERFKDVPQVHAYLSPKEGTDLPEDSCDLAFFSKVYHHLSEGTHVDYLRHLTRVIKPTGRLCVIERYLEITPGTKSHGWTLSLLIKQAEEAGWIPVRYELIRGTYHYMVVFVRQDLFPPEPKRKRGKG
jgi:ubiquinone/menaquinone biosynthesis C-methylase UbiE